MKYNYLLFDLDGTLTDPMIGITKSVAYSLKRMRHMDVPLEELTRFIGPPLKNSYMDYYGFTEEESDEAIELFRDYFKDTGIYENELYPGIKELLGDLKKSGKALCVATSKPTVFAKQIMTHFGLEEYFTYVYGSNLDGTRTKKAEVIVAVLDKIGIEDRAEVIMIGDREHDIKGAKEERIDSIGVEYGYGNYEELNNAGADHIVSSVEALRALLMDKHPSG